MSQYSNKSNMIYKYSAFGFRIDSEILLPELQQNSSGPAKVRISCGAVPDKINAPLEETYYYQAGVDVFLIRIVGVASYYITNGQQIIVQPVRAARDLSIRLYLLGTAMGVLLMQRGVIPIHGSTVVIDGHGVIFTGVSGAGKSTIAAALHKQGYPLLADDVSAVTNDHNGMFWVQPGYPQQKLWQDTASMLKLDTISLDKICADRDKYAVPVSAGFGSLSIPIAAIYEIVVKSCSDISVMPIKGIAKLATILGNTYRTEYIKGLGLKIPHFTQCANIVKQVPVFRLIRPANAISLTRQAAIVLQHFRDCIGLPDDRYVEEVSCDEKAGN